HHPAHGWRILDYKAGDRPVKPLAAHRRNGAWCDLQLPLYHWLLADDLEAAGPGRIDVGYVHVGSAGDREGCVTVAPELVALRDGAVAAARDVVVRIRRGEFAHPAAPP